MTEKQLKWQKRSRILWRLKGMVGFPFEEGVLTSLEHERLNVAFSIIRGVVQDSSLLLREVSIVENIKNIWRKDNAKDNYMPRNTK